MNTGSRAALAALGVALALVLQTSVLPAFAWHGVVPNLVLLVVVGVALTQQPQLAVVAGFAAGALLDLAPPADHVAGRWALALLAVAYVAARVRPTGRPSASAAVGTVAACSFIGTSVFALSGLLLRDPLVATSEVLQVVGTAVLLDVLAAPLVLPVLLAVAARLEPDARPVLRRPVPPGALPRTESRVAGPE